MLKGHFAALLAVFMIWLQDGSEAQGTRMERGTSSAQEMEKANWVDSIYNSLTLEERIGQLFMVAAYSGGKNYNESIITDLIQILYWWLLLCFQYYSLNQDQFFSRLTSILPMQNCKEPLL